MYPHLISLSELDISTEGTMVRIFNKDRSMSRLITPEDAVQLAQQIEEAASIVQADSRIIVDFDDLTAFVD